MSDGLVSRRIDRIAAVLLGVPGVAAVVLGGSRARGWHDSASDVDLGIYYRGSVDIAQLDSRVAALDDSRRTGLASAHGGWGAWVDGGAWLQLDGLDVDLIYRDLARVDVEIGRVRAGQFSTAYHFGHPHAYVSAAYAGEMAICRPLADPNGEVSRRKQLLVPYPPLLRAALCQQFLEEATFSLPLLAKAERRHDVTHTMGCAYRIVACLTQTLFALNREWLSNEKGAVARIETFALRPADFARLVAQPSAARLEQLVDATRELVTRSLAAG